MHYYCIFSYKFKKFANFVDVQRSVTIFCDQAQCQFFALCRALVSTHYTIPHHAVVSSVPFVKYRATGYHKALCVERYESGAFVLRKQEKLCVLLYRCCFGDGNMGSFEVGGMFCY